MYRLERLDVFHFTDEKHGHTWYYTVEVEKYNEIVAEERRLRKGAPEEFEGRLLKSYEHSESGLHQPR